jgi:hypothetical protein
MLKNAGVDRFSLAQRLCALDPDQVQNLIRLFEAQLAVVARRVEELRLCERYLLQKTHSKRLEEVLIPQLPLESEQLEALSGGPAGPFRDGSEILGEIAEQSPISTTRQLAALALLRQGKFSRKIFAEVREALEGKELEIAVEAALGLAHWRVRAFANGLWESRRWGGAEIDRNCLARTSSSVAQGTPLRPWAAAAFTLARYGVFGALPPSENAESADEADTLHSLRQTLRDGLYSADLDLRFTCAIALGEEAVIARALDDADEQKRTVARRFLALHNSPAVGSLLEEGTDEIRKEILADLSRPVPDALIQSVLRAIEHGDAEIRSTGTRLLQPTLTSDTVERLIRIARRETDLALYKILLEAERLPASEKVLQAIIGTGEFKSLYAAIHAAACHVDFSADHVAQLAGQEDTEILEMLISIKTVDARSASRETVRFLVRVAFGSYPAEARARAYDSLEYRAKRHWRWMSSEGALSFFGGYAGFTLSIARVFREPELHQMSIRLMDRLLEEWQDLGPHLGEDHPALNEFIAVLVSMVRENFWNDWLLQTNAATVIARLAALYPGETLPALGVLLQDSNSLVRCSDLVTRLLDEYPGFGPHFANSRTALEEFVRALLDFIKEDNWYESPHKSACILLGRVLADYPQCRGVIRSVLAPILDEWIILPTEREESLQWLGEQVGLKRTGKTRIESEVDREPQEALPADLASSSGGSDRSLTQLEELDHAMLLPEEPIPTLAGYVKFLKTMNASASPMEVTASYGMNVDQWVSCVTAWSELLCQRDEVANRYGQLLAGSGQQEGNVSSPSLGNLACDDSTADQGDDKSD